MLYTEFCVPALYDVFFSYAHSDGPCAREIVEALRACGLRVWFDEREIADFESITGAITEGLARSKALVAYYSARYPLRRACQFELTAAFLAAQREGDPRRRVLVVNPEPGAGHIQPVELRDAKYVKPEDPHLAEAVCDRVSGLDGVMGDIHPLAQPRWFGMRGVGSTRFVGRLAGMWQIHSALHAGEVAVITGVARGGIAQVRGLGGIGKSLLAEEYGLRFGAAYPGGVFWLRAYGNDDAKAGMGAEGREAERERQVRDFAALLELPVRDRTPEEIEGALAREVERRGLPCLWVVDDVPSGLDGQALRRWFAPHPLAKTLVTTRSREYGAQAAALDLGVLDEEEAYELLTSRRQPHGEAEEAAARGLIQDLGGHALAVDVARAALAQYAGLKSFAQFRAELAAESQDALELATELSDALPNGHEKSIAGTLLHSIRQAGEQARDFLRLASVLAVAPIPPRLVAAVFGKADGLEASEAERRAALALKGSRGLSLAGETGRQEGACTVHTLVARAVRFRDPVQERRQALRAAAIEVLTTELSEKVDDPRLHRQIEFEVAHARELASKARDCPEANLLGWVAQYDLVRGAYRSAEALYRRQGQVLREILGPEHPETLTSMNNLAETLRAQGDLAGARKLEEEALEILRRVLGPEHLATLASMNNLASTLQAQGDLAGARKLHQETLEIRRRVLGPEHPDTLTSMNNLALTLRTQGDLAASRKLHEEELQICRRVLGPEHPETLTSTNNLGLTLRAQGDLAGARKLHEETLEIRRRVLGPEHPDTLTSMNNLAATLHAQGYLAGARKLQEQVIEILRRVLGPEHPDASISAWNLFCTLAQLGDRAAASALLNSDLLWLLNRDPAALGAHQRKIWEMLARRAGQVE